MTIPTVQLTDSSPRAKMAIIHSDRTNNKRSMGSATSSPLKQQHQPPSKVGPPSQLPLPVPPGTVASKYEHFFMDHCEFRPSPVHGHGIFATQDIEPGTQIIKENALWVVNTKTAVKATFSEGSDYSAPRHTMIDAFYRSNLDEEDEEERFRLQHDVLRLSGGLSGEEMLQGDVQEDMQTLSERLREVLIINGVAESCDGQANYAAIFRASSRLNHSCAPNAERMRSSLNNGSLWATVSAISPIKQGEEIFINYLDPLARSDFRQKMFQSRWNFTCTCKLCTRPSKEIEASDDRREKIENAMGVMRDAQKKHAEPQPKRRSDEVHKNHLQQCDKATLGEAGWQVIEKFAAVEGVNDLKLFNSITHAADAARRLKKLSLETKLTDRLVAVCHTNSISPEMDRNVESRRLDLLKAAQHVAVLAHLQELANGAT